MDFSIQVLSSGSWPFQQSFTFSLPTEVKCLAPKSIKLNLFSFYFFLDPRKIFAFPSIVLLMIMFLFIHLSLSKFVNFYLENKTQRGKEIKKAENKCKEHIHTHTYCRFSSKCIKTRNFLFRILLMTFFRLQLERSVHRFTNFYSSQHSGRKLNWLYNMSKGELHTNCFKNRYTLQASTFQMAVLLQYNGAMSWTIQQLHYATQIKTEFLLQVM